MTRFLRNTLFAVGFMSLGAAGTLSMGALAGHGPGYGGGHGYGGGPGTMVERLADDLDLTDAQRAALDAIRDDARDEWSDRHEERQGMMRQMAQHLAEDEIDAKAVHAEIDKKVAERAAELHDIADRLIEFHATLTPAQKATLADRVQQIQERRGMGDCDGSGPHGRGR